MAMSCEQQDEQAKPYGRIVAKAWSDEAFKQRFMAEPAAVLKEHGIQVARESPHAHRPTPDCSALTTLVDPWSGNGAITDCIPKGINS